jgi:hypothetical protein
MCKELTVASIQWPVVVPHGQVREHIIHFVNEEIKRQNALEMEEEVIMPSPFMRRVSQARREGFKEGLSKGTASGIALGLLLAAGLVGLTLIIQ